MDPPTERAPGRALADLFERLEDERRKLTGPDLLFLGAMLSTSSLKIRRQVEELEALVDQRCRLDMEARPERKKPKHRPAKPFRDHWNDLIAWVVKAGIRHGTALRGLAWLRCWTWIEAESELRPPLSDTEIANLWNDGPARVRITRNTLHNERLDLLLERMKKAYRRGQKSADI